MCILWVSEQLINVRSPILLLAPGKSEKLLKLAVLWSHRAIDIFFFTSSQKCERPNRAPLNHKQPFFLAGGFKHRAKYSVFSAFISWSLAVVQNKEWRSKNKRKSICCIVAKQKNSFVFVSREHRKLCFPSLVSMWPGEIRQEETGGWYQIRSTLLTPEGKTASFLQRRRKQRCSVWSQEPKHTGFFFPSSSFRKEAKRRMFSAQK